MGRSTLSARARFAAARVWHRRARHRGPRCGGCARPAAPPRARGRVVVLREGFGGLVRAVCAVVHRARRDGPRAARPQRLSDGRHADAADSAPGPGRRRARERLEDRRALRRQHRGRGDRRVPHGFRTGAVVRSHEHAIRRGPPERDRAVRGAARSLAGHVDTSAEDGAGRTSDFREASRSPPQVARTALVPGRALRWCCRGFAAMGLEIVWLRHFTLLLGGFRAVFSLVLTIMLVGIGAGSLFGGWIDRRTARPAQALMVVQALLVVTALIGLGWTSVEALDAHRRAIAATLAALTPLARWFTELWFNARPMLIEIGVPALLMGCSFPLGNAVIQQDGARGRQPCRRSCISPTRPAPSVVLSPPASCCCRASACRGRDCARARRGAGDRAALPGRARRQRRDDDVRHGRFGSRADCGRRGRRVASAAGGLRAGSLSRRTVGRRAAADAARRRHRSHRRDGSAGPRAAASSPTATRCRRPRCSTSATCARWRTSRCCRCRPRRACSSSASASATPRMPRRSIRPLSASMSPTCLATSSDTPAIFCDANRDVLNDPRVRVYVNDGRQHLAMQAAAAYDLITLEPPPIAHAGVGALYSREFYELARSRLKPGGYLSQWLPAYQVPPETSLAMVRAFIDVFPQCGAAVGNASRAAAHRHERRPHRDRSGARRPRARSGPRRARRTFGASISGRDGNRRDVCRIGGNAGPCHARIAAGIGRPSASGIRRALRHRHGNERRAGALVDLRRGRSGVHGASTANSRRPRPADWTPISPCSTRPITRLNGRRPAHRFSGARTSARSFPTPTPFTTSSASRCCRMAISTKLRRSSERRSSAGRIAGRQPQSRHRALGHRTHAGSD